MPRGKKGVHNFDQIAYMKEKFVRVPLDLRVPVYNALSEHSMRTGEPINTMLKRWISENVPQDLVDAHKDDKEKRRC